MHKKSLLLIGIILAAVACQHAAVSSFKEQSQEAHARKPALDTYNGVASPAPIDQQLDLIKLVNLIKGLSSSR